MSRTPRPPEQRCSDPGIGKLLAAYLEGRLSPENDERFEIHYFHCKACLAEIRLRQMLPEALEAAPEQGGDPVVAQPGPERPAPPVPPRRKTGGPGTRGHHRAWIGWVAAAAVLAGFAVLVGWWPDGFSGGRRGGEPVLIRLESAYRGQATGNDQAPLDRPLALRLTMPVGGPLSAHYDIVVTGPHGQRVGQAENVSPSGPSEIPLDLPAGVERPGLYVVEIVERVNDSSATPMRFHYTFEAVRNGR
ncbi:MAG: zf-HC2 domain-containing protein [Acidobacteriota bacterium]